MDRELPEIREMIMAATNGGKSWFVINERAVPLAKEGYTPFMCTLDNNIVFEQDYQEIIKTGAFKNIVRKRAAHKELYNDMDFYLGTTNHAYAKDWLAGIAYPQRRLILLDEFDLITFKVNNYKGVKREIFDTLLDNLRKEDRLACTSASITQTLTMDLSFNKFSFLHPYKDGYRSLLSGYGRVHSIGTITDADLESLKVGNKLTSAIVNSCSNSSPDYKLGINVTNFVAERETGAFLSDIAKKIKKIFPFKRIYTLKGGKHILPKDDWNYINADIVIIGQPGNRAMVLPNIYNMIWAVPALLDASIQQQRMNNYFDDNRSSAYWVTSEGKDILQESVELQEYLYDTVTDWGRLELAQKEEWACDNLKYKGVIKLFSRGKSGNYKEQRVKDNYIDKTDYSEAILKAIEEMGYNCIDKVTKTEGTEGTYLQTTKTQRWVNMPASNPSRYDTTGAARTNGLVPFGDPQNKKAGETKLILSTTPHGIKYSQLHIEGDKLLIKTYDSKRSFNNTKELRLKKNGKS